MMQKEKTKLVLIAAVVTLSLTSYAFGQDGKGRGAAKPVTVPVTIRLRDSKPVEMRFVDYLLREDGEMQVILSARLPSESPMTLAILIQDDLASSVSSDFKRIADFVRNQPGGSRVMIGYIRTGSLEVRRKFTNELDKAASSVRPPPCLASAGPFNPYVEIIEALRRFDSQPLGRRALIVVSDGLDVSRGADSSAPGQSLDLERAITQAQRRSVAIYSIYAPSAASVPHCWR